MSNHESSEKTEKLTPSQADQHKGIENHKTVATHLQTAAKHHLDAAKHHEVGDHEKAAASTIHAHGHMELANEGHKEDAKHHALKG